jgi:hypothetical protein
MWRKWSHAMRGSREEVPHAVPARSSSDDGRVGYCGYWALYGITIPRFAVEYGNEVAKPVPRSRWLEKLIFPLIATVIALAFIVPALRRPDLQLVDTTVRQDPASGLLWLGIKVHNDNSKSAVGCIGSLEMHSAKGTIFTYKTTTVFSVPGQDYAAGGHGTGIPEFYLPRNFFSRLSRPGWTADIYVTCQGYQKKIGGKIEG